MRGWTVIDLTGAIDLHVHSAPDIYPRSADDFEVAKAAEAAGMRGILLKSHHTLTSDRAALVDRRSEITVRGGLALNLSVGGFNPEAVETAIAFGARQIWMPTIHARNCLHTATGEMFEAEARRGHAGLTAFDEGGRPSEGLATVLELVRDADIMLGTGHLAPAESLALLRHAADLGIRRKLVTHPLMSFTRFSIEQMTQATELGAYLEFDALCCEPTWPRSLPATATAQAIREVGSAHCVLASDGGQAANPEAPSMLLAFARQLNDAGIDRASLHRMMCDNPAFLLGL